MARIRCRYAPKAGHGEWDGMSKDVLLAAVIGAQGLKGEVKAKLFTASPDALPRYGVLHTKTGRKLKITAFRPGKEGEAVIAFEGIGDRDQAEALKGSELFVERAALPEPDEEEFYHADLIGLEVRDSEGRMLGRVSALHNFGASDVLEFARPDGDSVHLAFTKETVPVINVTDGFIVVAVPEDDEDTDHVE
jgi:16S rRNA processing protein RimM